MEQHEHLPDETGAGRAEGEAGIEPGAVAATPGPEVEDNKPNFARGISADTPEETEVKPNFARGIAAETPDETEPRPNYARGLDHEPDAQPEEHSRPDYARGIDDQPLER